MDYSIDKFIGYLNKHEGLSHTNRYSVDVEFPAGISYDKEGLNLICSSAMMPGHPILTADRVALGNPVKVPYSFATEQAEFIFLLDGNYKAMEAFDAWSELIVNNRTHSVAYKKDIIANKWTGWQLNKMNEKTAGVMLYNIFPVMIGKVDFSDAAHNQIQSLPISVVFDWRQVAPF